MGEINKSESEDEYGPKATIKKLLSEPVKKGAKIYRFRSGMIGYVDDSFNFHAEVDDDFKIGGKYLRVVPYPISEEDAELLIKHGVLDLRSEK